MSQLGQLRAGMRVVLNDIGPSLKLLGKDLAQFGKETLKPMARDAARAITIDHHTKEATLERFVAHPALHGATDALT